MGNAEVYVFFLEKTIRVRNQTNTDGTDRILVQFSLTVLFPIVVLTNMSHSICANFPTWFVRLLEIIMLCHNKHRGKLTDTWRVFG